MKGNNDRGKMEGQTKQLKEMISKEVHSRSMSFQSNKENIEMN
jgi:hypothetical protein